MTVLEAIKVELQRQMDSDENKGLLGFLDLDRDDGAIIDGQVDLVALAAAVEAVTSG